MHPCPAIKGNNLSDRIEATNGGRFPGKRGIVTPKTISYAHHLTLLPVHRLSHTLSPSAPAVFLLAAFMAK